MPHPHIIVELSQIIRLGRRDRHILRLLLALIQNLWFVVSWIRPLVLGDLFLMIKIDLVSTLGLTWHFAEVFYIGIRFLQTWVLYDPLLIKDFFVNRFQRCHWRDSVDIDLLHFFLIDQILISVQFSGQIGFLSSRMVHPFQFEFFLLLWYRSLGKISKWSNLRVQKGVSQEELSIFYRVVLFHELVPVGRFRPDVLWEELFFILRQLTNKTRSYFQLWSPLIQKF